MPATIWQPGQSAAIRRIVPGIIWAPLRFAGTLLAIGTLTGCTSVGVFRGIPLNGDNLYVSGVPPLRQSADYACGPTCLAAVGVHWGVSLEQFRKQCPAAPHDATGADLRALAESLGLQAFVFQGSMDDLKDNLRHGRPVIVMMAQPPDPALGRVGILGNIALAISERVSHPPHWVVVVGFMGGDEVIVHDPAAGPLRIKQPVFQQWWQRERNLCVLVAAK